MGSFNKDDESAAVPNNDTMSPGSKGHDDSDEKRNSLEAALPSELVSAGSQHLQRRLGGKEVQLIAIGGAIGTCKN